jgi:S1-C subfamily serine protease
MVRTTKSTALMLPLFLLVLAVFSLGCQAITRLPQALSAVQSQSIAPTSAAVSPVDSQPTNQQVSPSTIFSPDAPLSLDLVAQDQVLVSLYEKVNPGVVAIQILTADGGGLGSGFVLDKDGHIVTNYHVIEGNTDLEVDFSTGLKVRGRVIGSDTDSDLAIIKVDVPASELHPLTMGDSSQLKVGQAVVAIGNPFGLSGTMTVGIVSALGRTLESLHESPSGAPYSAGDIIQTDAAINPGNSGGPLLNLNGEVVGINRAIRTFNFTQGLQSSPLNSGVGFAVAINIVKRVAPALLETGKYVYPYLGISSLSDISLLTQEALKLPQSTGAYITSVTPGGPADKAGLRGGSVQTEIAGLLAGGDLIIAIDQIEVREFGELLSYIMNYKQPGDVVTLTVLRNSKKIQLELTLGKRP